MATTPATRNGNGGLAKASPAQTVHDLLMRSKAQIALALPKHMDPDRLCRIALTTIRQTPKLLDCDPTSLIKCVVQCAGLGLEPDPLLGRAYIVPYGREATVIIGYKGLIDLARRSGEIQSVEAHVVYEGDQWDYAYGLSPVLYHKPADGAARGKPVAAWALALFKGGGHQFEVMGISELEAIRKASRAGNNGPWVTHTAEMYRKTVLRRLAKLLPLSPNLARHIAQEETIEAGGEVYAGPYDDDTQALPPPDAADTGPQSESDKVLSRMGGPTPLPDDTEAGSRG